MWSNLRIPKIYRIPRRVFRVFHLIQEIYWTWIRSSNRYQEWLTTLPRASEGLHWCFFWRNSICTLQNYFLHTWSTCSSQESLESRIMTIRFFTDSKWTVTPLIMMCVHAILPRLLMYGTDPKTIALVLPRFNCKFLLMLIAHSSIASATAISSITVSSRSYYALHWI